jgi:hypothetical protein
MHSKKWILLPESDILATKKYNPAAVSQKLTNWHKVRDSVSILLKIEFL